MVSKGIQPYIYMDPFSQEFQYVFYLLTILTDVMLPRPSTVLALASHPACGGGHRGLGSCLEKAVWREKCLRMDEEVGMPSCVRSPSWAFILGEQEGPPAQDSLATQDLE